MSDGTVRQALLVMDYQVGIVRGYCADDPSLVERTAAAARFARDAGIPVVYVRVAFRPGYPELHPANRNFRGIDEIGRFRDGDPDTAIDPRVAPAPGEVVVTKHRVGGFFATDLDQVLRSSGVTGIVLAGIATSGVVLSTLRDGADRDYDITVLRDCCTDRDPVVHDVLMDKVFPRQAAVTTSAAWQQEVAAQPARDAVRSTR
jgi:nicotinamidase-related amidase